MLYNLSAEFCTCPCHTHGWRGGCCCQSVADHTARVSRRKGDSDRIITITTIDRRANGVLDPRHSGETETTPDRSKCVFSYAECVYVFKFKEDARTRVIARRTVVRLRGVRDVNNTVCTCAAVADVAARARASGLVNGVVVMGEI